MGLCYDPEIDEPICLPQVKRPGRYVAEKPEGKKSLIMKDSCTSILEDYYGLIDGLFLQDTVECQYSDEEYELVSFNDLKRIPEKTSIVKLLDSCIVKGPGEWYVRFQPNKNINRTEFMKMLVKTVFLGYDLPVIPESNTYQ